MSQTAERIRDFLIDEAQWDRPRAELSDELPLIENQVIDSMMLLRLVEWLETEYGVSVTDAEIVPSNFGSIASIAELVTAKLARVDRA